MSYVAINGFIWDECEAVSHTAIDGSFSTWLSEYETNEADTHRKHLLKAGLYDLVIIARKVPPVPISNTTVKLLSADGTMSQGMGEYVVAKSYKPAFFCF